MQKDTLMALGQNKIFQTKRKMITIKEKINKLQNQIKNFRSSKDTIKQ